MGNSVQAYSRTSDHSPERLFEALSICNPLFQSPTTGGRHDGTNASHHFGPYDFESELPDKFRALSTEIFVGEADPWVDTAKDECLTWMGEECSAAHSVDVNLDLRLGLRATMCPPARISTDFPQVSCLCVPLKCCHKTVLV